MIPIIEPIEAGLIVALISKLIINNPRFWAFWCGEAESLPEGSKTEGQEQKQEHEYAKDSSSSTTSVNELEIHTHHFDPWMHT